MENVNDYENRIVVFIDILGFSSIVKSTDNSDVNKREKKQKEAKEGKGILDNLTDALHFIRVEVEKLKESGSSIKISQFSDSLVISSSDESNEILTIFHFLKYVQVNLLTVYNILIRGGVVRGKVIHTEHILVGPAMVDAYNLESKCANSPRIVVMPSVRNIYDNERKKSGIEKKYSVLKQDYDGMFYIDYFNNLEPKFVDSEVEYINKIENIINMNSKRRDVTIKVKYYWMRSKLEDREKATKSKILHNSKVS